MYMDYFPGIYDVVNNLGSMAARFLFEPIEESGYLLFSQLLVRGEPVTKQKQVMLLFYIVIVTSAINEIVPWHVCINVLHTCK